MAIETYSLSIQGVHKQERNEVVMHFTGDPVTADDTWTTGKDLVDAFEDQILTAWLDMFPVTYYVDRLVARRVHPKGFSTQYHKQYQNNAQHGSISGEAQTQQLCPVVRIIPGTGVKSMGKVFLPCIAEGSINGNIYQSGYLAAIDNFFPNSISGFSSTGANWFLAVYSRKLDSPHLAVAYLISPAIGYQRRRRSPV